MPAAADAGAPAVAGASPAAEPETDDLNLERAVEALSRRFIQRALERAGDNKAEAARLLGIGRPNLHAKMKELGLIPPA